MAHGESVLRTGEILTNNQYLTSKNGFFHAVMQDDGNFVIYRGSSFSTASSLWDPFNYDTDGAGLNLLPGEYTLEMQSDGNLVVFKHANGGKSPFWELGKRHEKIFGPDRWALLSDDGNFSVGPRGEFKNRDFSTDRTDHADPKSLVLESLVYDLTYKDKLKPGDVQAGIEIGVSNTADLAQSPSVTVSYSKTKTSTWSSASTVTAGLKTTVTAGVPGVASGSVEISGSISTSFTFGKTEGTTETASVTTPVNVPAHSKGSVKCVWQDATISLPYKAIGKVKFKNLPDMMLVKIDGVYSGIATHNVQIVYSPNVPIAGNVRAGGLGPEDVVVKRFDPDAQ